MKTRTIASLGLKIIVLTFVLFGLYSIDFLGLALAEEAQTTPLPLLLASLLHAAVLSYPILRSRWNGWRLVAAIFLVFYGVTTLMVAIEAVYLPEALPPDLVTKLVVNGAISAAVFSAVAVLIHGRMKRAEGLQVINRRLIMPFGLAQGMPWTQWIWKLALIAFSWVFLFILFGALVFLPLAGHLAPDALQDYTNLEMPAWILPFQMVRALVWAALTLPVIPMMKGPALRPVLSLPKDLPKGHWWETGLVVALLFSVLMGANLLRPTGLPVGLRIAHFLEVFGENFMFGWIVVCLLHRRHGRSVSATA